MPDINNKPLRIGAGVTVVAKDPTSQFRTYDGLHGEIVTLHPCNGEMLADVDLDNTLYGNILIEGYLLLQDPEKKRKSEPEATE